MVIFGAIFGGALFYTQGCEAWDVSKISIGMLLVGILLNALMIPRPHTNGRTRTRGDLPSQRPYVVALL